MNVQYCTWYEVVSSLRDVIDVHLKISETVSESLMLISYHILDITKSKSRWTMNNNHPPLPILFLFIFFLFLGGGGVGWGVVFTMYITCSKLNNIKYNLQLNNLSQISRMEDHVIWHICNKFSDRRKNPTSGIVPRGHPN